MDARGGGLELTVYFDADCPLCRRVVTWLDGQPKFVPLHCVPLQGVPPQATAGPSRRSGPSCPLDAGQLLEQLTVTGNDGSVYRGTKAWIMCLWSLRAYRGWSLRLSTETLWPWARRMFALITGLANLTKPTRQPS